MNYHQKIAEFFRRAGLIIVYGALSLAAQVIILREFLMLALGSELYLGLGLWAWLVWTGLGSLLGGRLAGNSRISRKLLGQLLAWLAASLPLTVILVRALPTLLGWTAGAAPSPRSLVIWYVVLSGPYCLVAGLFFPLACSWLRDQQTTIGLVGQAYGLDALGMGLGGLLLMVLLLGGADSLWLAQLGAVAVLGPLVWLLVGRRRRTWVLGAILVLTAGIILAATLTLPEASRRWQWPHRLVLAVVETPYSVWTATREAEQTSFAANGLWFFSYPDPQTTEEQVHYALLQHPQPERVLLLGGGVAGLAGEILKTPGLQQVDYVELDPRLIGLAKRVLPPEARQPFQDQRLRVIYDDGRRFLRWTGQVYDVIIMALPEPRNALLNRFYTGEFFSEVKARLAPGGVFSFGLAGSETSLSPPRARFLGMTAATLRSVFSDVIVLPGLTWRFFASPETGALTIDSEVLMSRRQARELDLFFVREYYLKANLSPARQAYARLILDQAAPEINTDLMPLGLFYGLLLTGLEEYDLLPRFLLRFKALGVTGLYVALALLTLALWWWGRKQHSARRQMPHLYSVFAMGFGVMGFEMVILILFQVTLGYLYGQLSLLLAAFMAGMAAGSYLTGSYLVRWAPPRVIANLSQGGLALFMLGLALGLPWLLGLPHLHEAGWGQLIFALLLITGGLLGGALFATQGELSQQDGVGLSLSAGRLYAVDLFGATLGTLGISFLVIPCFGLAQALFLGGALNASAFLVLLGTSPRLPPGNDNSSG